MTTLLKVAPRASTYSVFLNVDIDDELVSSSTRRDEMWPAR